MKMALLHDILKGLEALERQETQQITSTKKSTGFGKLINATRELPTIKRGPAGEPVSDDVYAVDYPAYPYEYDPDAITFLDIEIGSPEHHAKLADFHRISQYDPTTAHKILTLA